MTIDALVLSAMVAVAAGLIGCFAVMRRMALAADALSHVALPGIGVALALHLHPVFGAAAMLLFGGLLVWAVEDRSHLATETIIGVIFSAALAIGSMITSGDDLLDALFGGTTGAPSPAELVLLSHRTSRARSGSMCAASICSTSRCSRLPSRSGCGTSVCC